MRLARLAWLVALAAGCRDATGVGPGGVLEHRRLWESRGITSYSYVYEQTGFFICCVNGRQLTVVVRDDTVQSVLDRATGQPIALPVPSPTVAYLFDRAEAAARSGLLLGIDYDPRFGYPTRIDVGGPPDASGSFYASELAPVF